MGRTRTGMLKTSKISALVTPKVRARLHKIAETWQVSEAEALARAIDRTWENVTEGEAQG